MYKSYSERVDDLAVAVFFDLLNKSLEIDNEADFESEIFDADMLVSNLGKTFKGTEDIAGHKLVRYAIEAEREELSLIKHIEWDESMSGNFSENTRIELAFAKMPMFEKIRAIA